MLLNPTSGGSFQESPQAQQKPWKVILVILALSSLFTYLTGTQGIVAAFAFYPIVLLIYITMPKATATRLSLVILLINLPLFFLTFDLATAIRLSVSLSLIGVFSEVFFAIIESHGKKIRENEQLRKEQAANTLHELKNSLSVMLAMIEAMRDGIRPVDEPRLKTILESNEYLRQLLNDLTLLSGADVKHLCLNKQNTDLAVLLQESINAQQAHIAGAKAILKVHLPESPVIQPVDPLRMRQVIDNLLSNALKYAGLNSEIHLSLQAPKGQIQLTIEDSGPGVSDAALPQLFDRFYRERQPLNRDINGSGLGLSIVKTLIALHSGTVQAFPSKLGGLGIRISLPLTSTTV